MTRKVLTGKQSRMLLSSQPGFNYEDQTSSSKSLGDGSSGRGTITESVTGSVGRLSDGPVINDSERRNLNERPNNNLDRDTRRDNLRHIALTTLQILDDGEYFPPGQNGPYDLRAKILWTDENTRYYGPDAGEGGEILKSEFRDKEEERSKDVNTGVGEEADDASYLKEKQRENESEKGTAAAASRPHDGVNANPKDQTRVQATASQKSATPDNTQTSICVGEYSTLVGARKVHLELARNTDLTVDKKIGVLNFASAKKPGGGFISGSQAQEESLARSSTLYPSLITDAAYQFYTHYHEDPSNAYYTHAMVYSPGIVLIRDDNGEWSSPVEVDVLTSAAVNAGEIRRELEREERLRMERVVMEYWKKRGEERRKENERAVAERQRQREENKNAKEEIPKLKEQANLVKFQKEMDKGRPVAKVENENEKREEAGERPGEKRENTVDSPDNGIRNDSNSQLKGTEENTESKGTLPEVNQEPTSSSTIVQPSQTPDPDPYALALKNAEIQIEQIMYARIFRILHVFQLHQTPHLILGSFGTGVFKNRIDLVATIFADLLIKPGGRFKDVFQTVVFAILGKETVRVFSDVFSRVAHREGTGKTRMFVESFDSESDGDVKEGDEEKTKRMMKWKARRSELERKNSFMYVIPDAALNAASFDPASAFHPLSFDAAQANAISDPTSSSAADAASYAAKASEAANAASSNAVKASAAAYAASHAPSSEAAQADAAASTAYSKTAQACEAASTAYSNAAQACAAASAAYSNAAQANEADVTFSQAEEAVSQAKVAGSHADEAASQAEKAKSQAAEANSHAEESESLADDAASRADAVHTASYAPIFDAAQTDAAACSNPTQASAAAFAASSNAFQSSAAAYSTSSGAFRATAANYDACSSDFESCTAILAATSNAAQARGAHYPPSSDANN